jgi:hypothetical protein
MNLKNIETPDQRPLDCVRSDLEGRRLEQNREAIARYNRRVAERGLLSDDACDGWPPIA